MASPPASVAAMPRTDAAPRDGAPPVALVDLHRAFGAQQVLRGVNAVFRAGQTAVVLGPSGSGKSVILKHIAVLLRPDRGEVRFGGQRIDALHESALGPIRKQMGYLFQQSALFDSMTVLENLEFPLIEHTGLSAQDRRARVAEALATVDLENVEYKYPAQLSGGQQKRVALARAIILRPRVILYDEPTTGLDPIRAAGISDLIIRLRDEMGVTGIVVTHDLMCTRRVADHVLMLYDGRFIFDGTLSQAEAASDPHVVHFMSAMPEAEEGVRIRAGAATSLPSVPPEAGPIH